MVLPQVFLYFSFFYDALLIDTIDFYIERISFFFLTVGPSSAFGPALNPHKIKNFRWYLIDLVSAVPKVSKTVYKTLTTPKNRFFRSISCLYC